MLEKFFKITIIAMFIASAPVLSNAQSRYSYKAETETQDILKFLQLRAKQEGKMKQGEENKVSFAVAEYYFKNNAITDARRAFEEYVVQNSTGISALLGNVYLYKMATLNHADIKIAALKKEIFKDPFILLFDKYKTLKYSSYVFGNRYEVHYYVNKIEVFLNDSLFEEISY